MERILLKVIICGLVCITSGVAFSHEIGASGVHIVEQHSKTINKISSASSSWNDFGLTTIGKAARSFDVNGRQCFQGMQFSMDVKDEYAFDIDEPVILKMSIDSESSGRIFSVAYDASGGPKVLSVSVVGEGIQPVEVELPDARFIGRGDQGGDIRIFAHGRGGNVFGPYDTHITLCDVEIERTFQTPVKEIGRIALTVLDETNKTTQARIGLYDQDSRAALPSTDAIAFKKFADRRQTMLMNKYYSAWPSTNRFTMYMDGTYMSSLPVGRYRLLASKGPEFGYIDQEFEIKSGEVTEVVATFKRFANLAADGWYSGDIHIHSERRDLKDSETLLKIMAAEGLNVGHILAMGNIATTYFEQRDWADGGGVFQKKNHAVTSGQEGPRTSIRGHTIHLGHNEMVNFPDEYLQYEKVFKEVEKQGGISGYSHLFSDKHFIDTKIGMALDAPFGVVDFAEIAQLGIFATEAWFDFLNMGYRIMPAAGSDYPYIDQPGSVRSYVKIDGDFTPDKWIANLAAGKTFVTNGPFLSMSVNGAEIGGEVRMAFGDEIVVNLRARQSSHLGPLESLSLISQGETIAKVNGDGLSEELVLTHSFKAEDSLWLVARADGQQPTQYSERAALSAPVFLIVDGDERTWAQPQVSFLTQKYRRMIENLERLNSNYLESHEMEWWDTGTLWKERFDIEMKGLSGRIKEAKARLDALSAEASH